MKRFRRSWRPCTSRGGPRPSRPALLAMVTLLQAYDRVGDADAVVTAQLDQRSQLVLGCLGATDAPFSQGVLVKFRERMIAHDLDRTLLTRTIELAKRRDALASSGCKPRSIPHVLGRGAHRGHNVLKRISARIVSQGQRRPGSGDTREIERTA